MSALAPLNTNELQQQQAPVVAAPTENAPSAANNDASRQTTDANDLIQKQKTDDGEKKDEKEKKPSAISEFIHDTLHLPHLPSPHIVEHVQEAAHAVKEFVESHHLLPSDPSAVEGMSEGERHAAGMSYQYAGRIM